MGNSATARVNIKNTGEAEGTYTAHLLVDGVVEATKDITISGKATGSISIPMVKEEKGIYTVEVAGQVAVLNVIEPVRPDTGTYITSEMPQGDARLTVENGLDLDSVVILASAKEPNRPVLAVYIQANDSYTIKRIGGGTYILYFSLGKDWGEGSNRFISEASYERFEDELEFVSSASNYSVITVTLHPVAGGTAATEHLDEDDFPDL